MGNEDQTGFFENLPWWIIITFLFTVPPVGLTLLALKMFAERSLKRMVSQKNRHSIRRVGVGMLGIGAMMALIGRGVSWLWVLGGLIAGGFSFLQSKEDNNYSRYMAVIGTRTVVPVSAIAASMSVGYEKCESDLQRMIDLGYFGTNKPYIDKHTRMFVLDGRFVPETRHSVSDVLDNVLQTISEHLSPGSRPAEASKPEPSVEKAPPRKEEPAFRQGEMPPDFRDKLCEIRLLNEAIADKHVSDQIDHIEMITTSIFENVSEHPEKVKQIQTFMNYYLPTTLKLLKAYAELEKQPTAGANIVSSRERIEKMLDQLTWAFDQQLNRMFESEALDINTDIKVLEQMMAKDGLGGGDMIMPGTGGTAVQRKP